MKKFFILFAALAFSFSSMAETKTEGFEAATAGTSYQGTVTVTTTNSDCGVAWTMYYGNVSTTSKINGNNSAALRLYTSNNYGYLQSTTPIDGLSNVAFTAKAATTNSAAIKVNIQESTDGTTWTNLATNVAIASTATDYDYDVTSGCKYIKICISNSSTKPTKSSAQLTIDDVVFTYDATAAQTATAPTLPASTVFTTDNFDVTITNAQTGATVYYTTDGTDPTTSSANFTGASTTFQISATTTVKAMAVATGMNNSSVASATYTKEAPIANTAATAYTTAQAIALIDANSSQLTTTEVYVAGTISKVDSYNGTYGSITYWLDEDAFEIYGGLSFSGAKFTAKTDLQIGDEVVVKGIIKKFNTTYEMDKNNVLISRQTAATQETPTLTLGTYKTSMTVGDPDDEYTVTYNGDGELSITSSDEAVAEAIIVDNTVLVSAKAAGTTTITISASETSAYYAANKTYTLTVEAPLTPAALPFAFDGGKANITASMKQVGLGSDYSSSPKLKFDDKNDYLLIRIAEEAATLAYDIKGNSFSGGTFDVLESADGITFTSVKSYTELGATASESAALKANTRFVKFIYTNKSNGNVALGNIAITAPETPKFFMSVTGYDSDNNDVTVDMSVYSDFHFVVNLPEATHSTLGAASATVRVEMNDVSGLGVVGHKSYTHTLSTGVEGIQAVLATKLSNAYSFAGETIPVKIVTATETAEFDYIISRDGTVITGTPSSSDAARTAWNVLMSKIEAGDNSGDSYMLFTKGSTFVLGNERLTFVNDYTLFEGSGSAFEDIFTSSNTDVVIEEIEGAAATTIQFYFATGSTLALGGSKATVTDVINIAVDNTVNIQDNYLSGIRDDIDAAAEGSKSKVAIHKFMDFFNDMIGIADNGVSIAANAKEIELGDVNEDGTVDVTDYSVLTGYLFDPSELPVPFNFWAADANQDGLYDVSDFSAIMEIIFND